MDKQITITMTLRELEIKNNHRMGFYHNIPEGHFCFMDDDGICHPNHKIWGKTTTFPFHYQGITFDKEIIENGVTTMHRWWIITISPVDTRDNRIIDNYMDVKADKPMNPEQTVNFKAHPDLPLMNRFYRGGNNKEASDKGIPYRCAWRIDRIPDELYNQLHPDTSRRGWYVNRNTKDWYAIAVRDDSLAWDIYLGTKKSPVMAIPYQSSSTQNWDNKIDNYLYNTLPAQKEREQRIQDKLDELARTLRPLKQVPVPAMKTGRGSDNTLRNVSITVNDIVHNVNALDLRDKTIIEKIEQQTGEYGAQEINIWIEPEETIMAEGMNECEIGIYIETQDIPVRGLQVQVDKPMGFTLVPNGLIDEGLMTNSLEIAKEINGIIHLARAKKGGHDATPLNGKYYTIKLKKAGAIPNIYPIDIIKTQFVGSDHKELVRKTNIKNAKIVVE